MTSLITINSELAALKIKLEFIEKEINILKINGFTKLLICLRLEK